MRKNISHSCKGETCDKQNVLLINVHAHRVSSGLPVHKKNNWRSHSNHWYFPTAEFGDSSSYKVIKKFGCTDTLLNSALCFKHRGKATEED